MKEIEFIVDTNLSLFSLGVDRPPKLPPRDTALYGPSLWAKPNAAQAQAAAAAGLPKKGAKKSWRRGPGPGMGIISLTRGFETLMT